MACGTPAGTCKFCVRGDENLCPESRYTGWDADGGYAEFTTVPAAFAHHLPAGYSDTELAPLLCAGIIGYRSLLRADLPPGGRLGIYGFGGSAHLTAQVAVAQGAEVHVMTRERAAQELALSLGAASAQGAADLRRWRSTPRFFSRPSAISCCLRSRRWIAAARSPLRASTLSDIPSLNYQRHLFQERQLRSVTSNTRNDAREFLAFAGGHHLEVTSPAVSARACRRGAHRSRRGPGRRRGGIGRLERRQSGAEPPAEVAATVSIQRSATVGEHLTQPAIPRALTVRGECSRRRDRVDHVLGLGDVGSVHLHAGRQHESASPGIGDGLPQRARDRLAFGHRRQPRLMGRECAACRGGHPDGEQSVELDLPASARDQPCRQRRPRGRAPPSVVSSVNG